jgi:steroid 5-alpha reductase family enzyme
MEFFSVYLTLGALIIGLMILLWLLSLALKNSSIVDIFWGTGFVVAVWASFALTPDGFLARKLLIAALVTIWGLRLSIYLFIRNGLTHEDFRYATWRKETGPAWWWQSFLRVFLLQGVILWIIAAPLLAAQFSGSPARLTWLDFLAIPIWAIGFYFESAGDWQLARFKANPANKGKVLNSGVWRYTRHPNYFGDAAQWWGFTLVAVAAGAWWTIFSPILMTLLLMRVSGVTLLEKTLKDARPGYQEYIETTSEFIPWFPRRKPGKPAKGRSL